MTSKETLLFVNLQHTKISVQILFIYETKKYIRPHHVIFRGPEPEKVRILDYVTNPIPPDGLIFNLEPEYQATRQLFKKIFGHHGDLQVPVFFVLS